MPNDIILPQKVVWSVRILPPWFHVSGVWRSFAHSFVALRCSRRTASEPYINHFAFAASDRNGFPMVISRVAARSARPCLSHERLCCKTLSSIGLFCFDVFLQPLLKVTHLKYQCFVERTTGVFTWDDTLGLMNRFGYNSAAIIALVTA